MRKKEGGAKGARALAVATSLSASELLYGWIGRRVYDVRRLEDQDDADQERYDHKQSGVQRDGSVI